MIAYRPQRRLQTATRRRDAPRTAPFSHRRLPRLPRLSRRTGVARTGGANTTYAYENDGDLASISHAWASGSGQAAATFTYAHDAAGRMVSVSASRPELEWQPNVAYARTYGTANNLNQVASEAGTTLTFGNNGNLRFFGAQDFGWSHRHLAVYSHGSTSASYGYGYDSQDRRTARTVNGVMTRTLWSGADEVAELDAAAAVVRRFIPDGSGSMDGRLAAITPAGVIHWLHTDHQGSVIASSNSAGAPVSFANYSPFGELGTTAAGVALTAPPTGSPFGYTGRQYDGTDNLSRPGRRALFPDPS